MKSFSIPPTPFLTSSRFDFRAFFINFLKIKRKGKKSSKGSRRKKVMVGWVKRGENKRIYEKEEEEEGERRMVEDDKMRKWKGEEKEGKAGDREREREVGRGEEKEGGEGPADAMERERN